MSKNRKQQRNELAITMLNEQCERLQTIHNEYRTGFDAVFDEHGAGVTLKRWTVRTHQLIREHVGSAEGSRFGRALHNQPRGYGAWHWGEVCQYFYTWIVRLIEDIEQHPDDPSNDRLNEVVKDSADSVLPMSEKHDVFLSYSSIDKDEAREINDKLSTAGRDCFLSENNLKAGDNFRDEIRNALHASKEVWILVSPNSIKSDWVRREAAAAWALKKRIVPILLRCSAVDLPDDVADAHAIDFHKVDTLISQLTQRVRKT